MAYTIVLVSLMHKNYLNAKTLRTSNISRKYFGFSKIAGPLFALQSPFSKSGSDHVILKIEERISDLKSGAKGPNIIFRKEERSNDCLLFTKDGLPQEHRIKKRMLLRGRHCRCRARTFLKLERFGMETAFYSLTYSSFRTLLFTISRIFDENSGIFLEIELYAQKTFNFSTIKTKWSTTVMVSPQHRLICSRLHILANQRSEGLSK